MQTPSIREPAVAGMFYPEDPDTLNRDVDTLLNSATIRPISGEIVALISPHAGYQYSGLTAAHCYALLKGREFETVVVVSPSHREYFDGISVFSGSAFRTPLGVVAVNESLRGQLTKNDEIIEQSILGHRDEHALEVQLPFIQKTLKDFALLPIVMGDQRREYCYHLGEKIAEVLQGKNALIVASTDLSHYYPYDVAQKLDKIIIDDVAAFDYEQMMKDLETQRAEACGGGPTVAALVAASHLGANHVEILHHCNSGDITGDHRGVVGYLSAAVLRTN